MDIAIIIVNWNTRDILGQCLQSVFASQTAKQFEVWVVDNGSSDGSKQMIKESYPRTRLISNGDNVGFARANNQAVELSSGDYVMLLNPDTVVEKDVIESWQTIWMRTQKSVQLDHATQPRRHFTRICLSRANISSGILAHVSSGQVLLLCRIPNG